MFLGLQDPLVRGTGPVLFSYKGVEQTEIMLAKNFIFKTGDNVRAGKL